MWLAVFVLAGVSYIAYKLFHFIENAPTQSIRDHGTSSSPSRENVQKLCGIFPNVPRSLLLDILKHHNGSLEETTEYVLLHLDELAPCASSSVNGSSSHDSMSSRSTFSSGTTPTSFSAPTNTSSATPASGWSTDQSVRAKNLKLRKQQLLEEAKRNFMAKNEAQLLNHIRPLSYEGRIHKWKDARIEADGKVKVAFYWLQVKKIDLMEPSLQNILDEKSLKWIFVGGKGGVGKTTTSCSLAIQLSKVRASVLLISTDPAHNLSDAFSQKFGKDPTLVTGFENLYAMEIDPTATMDDLAKDTAERDKIAASSSEREPKSEENPLSSLFNSGLMSELSTSIPGADEAMGFAQVMKLVKSLEFSVIVFDTAPTGHTLRFLSFPRIMEKALGKLVDLTGKFGGMMQQFSGMLGMNISHQEAFSKLAEMKQTVEEVHRQFTDSSKTTFVCVCIAEFLSLYETERMIQELQSYKIDTHNIVVNQLLFPKVKSQDCDHCQARRKMQQKYLSQILDLYDDMHVIQLPLLTKEVRGVEDLEAFSTNLMIPFVADPSL